MTIFTICMGLQSFLCHLTEFSATCTWPAPPQFNSLYMTTLMPNLYNLYLHIELNFLPTRLSLYIACFPCFRLHFSKFVQNWRLELGLLCLFGKLRESERMSSEKSTKKIPFAIWAHISCFYICIPAENWKFDITIVS